MEWEIMEQENMEWEIMEQENMEWEIMEQENIESLKRGTGKTWNPGMDGRSSSQCPKVHYTNEACTIFVYTHNEQEIIQTFHIFYFKLRKAQILKTSWEIHKNSEEDLKRKIVSKCGKKENIFLQVAGVDPGPRGVLLQFIAHFSNSLHCSLE